MARSNSRIHGSQRASEEIGRGINTIKRRHRDKTLDHGANDHSTNPGANSPTGVPRPYSINQTSSFAQPHEGESESHEEDQGFGTSFRSSTSGSSSITFPLGEGTLGGSPFGLSIAMDAHDKSLPSTPRDPTANKEGPNRASVPEGMSFSFKPGDDEDILAQGDAREAAKRYDLEEHIRNRRHTVHHQKRRTGSPANPASIDRQGDGSRKPKVSSLMPDSRPRNTSSSRPRISMDPLIRGDSTSSIVTAVRDHSGPGSQHSSVRGRPHIDRHTSSSEAITAAARAIAASNKGRDQKPQRPELAGDKRSSSDTVKGGPGKAIVTVAATSGSGSSPDEPALMKSDNSLFTS